MSKVKMRAAREMIKLKQYDEAREILNAIDHPTAREWEMKLDQIAPHKKGKKITLFELSRSTSVYAVCGLGVLITVITVMYFLFSGNGSLPETVTHSGVTVDYPSGWKVTVGDRLITLISTLEDLENLDPEKFLLDGGRAIAISIEPGELQETTLLSYLGQPQSISGEYSVLGESQLIRIGERSVITFATSIDGLDGQVYLVDLGDGNALEVAGIALDIESFRPTIESVVASISIEPELLPTPIDYSRLWMASQLISYCEEVSSNSEEECVAWAERVVASDVDFEAVSFCDSRYNSVTDSVLYGECLEQRNIVIP